MNTIHNYVQPAYYANDNDALIPEIWAQESLMVLENNLVMGGLVHRDFEDEIANHGDVVNTRLPGSFVSKRKTDDDDVTDQDATSTNIPVKLDMHEHVSFVIKDGEESKSMKDLISLYAEPALIAIAQGIDENLVGEMWNFMSNNAGQLDTAIGNSTVLSARQKMIENKLLGKGPWNFLVNPASEADLLALELYTAANKVGDEGSALREGMLGRKHGFNFFTTQNMPSISALASGAVVTGAVNNASGHSAGDTSITVDGFSAAITAGSWCKIAGDDTPLFIVGSVGGATPTSITLGSPGLVRAVADNAVVTIVKPAAINLAAGYAAGYAKEMVIDGITVAPSTLQLASTGATVAARDTYGLRSTPSTTEAIFSRPLDTAVADNAVVGLGPAGNYNFAFQKEAIALVSRPLAQPREGTGAQSAVINYNGLAIRVTITYDGKAQGHRVVMDLLCGVKTMRSDHGVVIYG